MMITRCKKLKINNDSFDRVTPFTPLMSFFFLSVKTIGRKKNDQGKKMTPKQERNEKG